jgi:HAD superfamily hydrolase (TIGR01509 family)
LIDELKIDPREAIFIDDKERNIIGAKDAGLKTILFENIRALKRELSEYE